MDQGIGPGPTVLKGTIIMADQSKPKGQTPAAQGETPTAPTAPTAPAAVAVDGLPGKLYERAPNPRLSDVKNLVANPTRTDADGNTIPQWYKIVDKDSKDAATTANHIRRAAKELNIKLSVKLPGTEKGAVYFAASLTDDGKVQPFGAK